LFDASGLRERVLPPQFEFVPISCVRVAGVTTQCSFGAETRMCDILRIKGQTRGLNTNRLGRRNCHLTLWPLTVSRRLQSMAVVAFEHRIDVGDRLSFSVLDLDRQRACDVGDLEIAVEAPRGNERLGQGLTTYVRRSLAGRTCLTSLPSSVVGLSAK
jgi:hypothetical protein